MSDYELMMYKVEKLMRLWLCLKGKIGYKFKKNFIVINRVTVRIAYCTFCVLLKLHVQIFTSVLSTGSYFGPLNYCTETLRYLYIDFNYWCVYACLYITRFPVFPKFRISNTEILPLSTFCGVQLKIYQDKKCNFFKTTKYFWGCTVHVWENCGWLKFRRTEVDISPCP